MKARELLALGTCAGCGQPLLKGQPLPVLTILDIQAEVVDVAACRRADGLAAMLGSAGLAAAMGPDENLSTAIGERRRLALCMDCYHEPVSLAELVRRMDARQAGQSKSPAPAAALNTSAPRLETSEPCAADAPWTRDDEVLRDMLLLVDVDVPAATLATWSDAECQAAEEWAATKRDHDVAPRLMPACLLRAIAAQKGGVA